ncbi:hypothetical protein TWF694_006672 [Orbilia ellipsospora]|uniref:Major facilitator superfamily (MFS) profile domain-containing protein n=1 Tax=Orbilia ellipsospora TaxID=2528407 RepID=A0AAV9XLQ9_9PEZI
MERLQLSNGGLYKVIPLLPEFLAERLRIPQDQIKSWSAFLLEVYGASALIMSWVAGYFSDASASRQAPFIFGLVAMLSATLLFFLATNPYLIVLARICQGASQALVWVSGIAFLVSQVSESALGPAMGFITMCGTLGDLIGPLLGGPLYDKFGHWAVFGVVEALVGIDIFLRFLVKDKNREKKVVDEGEEPCEINESDPLIQNEQRQSGGTNGNDEMNSTSLSGTLMWKSTLRKLALEAIGSMIVTTIAVTIRCGLEATIPLFVIRRFEWSTSAAGGVIFSLLLPTTLGPLIGRYATANKPHLWSNGALFGGAILLFSLSNLTGKSNLTQTLFVVNLFLIGLCINIVTNIHGAAISVAAQKIDELRKKVDEVDKDGETLKTWGWKFVTMGMILSGLSTAWSLGMVLGPVCAHIVEYTRSEGWMMLCWFWGILNVLCVAIGVGTGFVL